MLASAPAFLETLFGEIQSYSFSFRHWSFDHLCYRTPSPERYLELKKSFLRDGALLGEVPIGGRPISSFKLHQPILFRGNTIDLVELPAPKPGVPTVEGWEHVEVVTDATFDELKNSLPTANWTDRGAGKSFNAELEWNLKSGAVKFHHQSLHSVVTLENHTDVFAALIDSQVLTRFRAYHPLVAGTFPLGISVKGSDLDILLHASNLLALAKEIKEAFGHLPDFQQHQSLVRGVPSLVTSFTFQEMPFELFAQNVPSPRQVAFQHFQVEEKCLKLGGPRFLEKIQALRASGLKTEAAFAKALGLSGEDPFEAMLGLAGKSERELGSYFAP